MTARYLLDTNAASAILRQQEPVCARAASVPLSALAISSVTAGEMHYGLAKRPQATTLVKLVREFLRYTDILHLAVSWLGQIEFPKNDGRRW